MKLRSHRARCNPMQLELFTWNHLAPEPLPLTYAALVLSRRYRLAPHFARLIATHAGYDVEARQ